jgi:hypothetical protein
MKKLKIFLTVFIVALMVLFAASCKHKKVTVQQSQQEISTGDKGILDSCLALPCPSIPYQEYSVPVGELINSHGIDLVMNYHCYYTDLVRYVIVDHSQYLITTSLDSISEDNKAPLWDYFPTGTPYVYQPEIHKAEWILYKVSIRRLGAEGWCGYYSYSYLKVWVIGPPTCPTVNTGQSFTVQSGVPVSLDVLYTTTYNDSCWISWANPKKGPNLQISNPSGSSGLDAHPNFFNTFTLGSGSSSTVIYPITVHHVRCADYTKPVTIYVTR